MNAKLPTKVPWQIAIGLTIIFASIFFWLGLAGFSQVQAVVNRLIPDGRLDSFTLAVYAQIRIVSLVLGALFGGALVGLWLRPNQFGLAYARFFQITSNRYRLLLQDARRILQSVQRWLFTGAEARWVWVFVGLGLILRLLVINRPIGHDEAYTYMAFVRRGLWLTVTDYHLPNNHVFHTVLVYFSTQIFGNSLWAIRLPAMLASLGLIPAVYLAAGRYFERQVGVLAAGLMAGLPVVLLYGSNARGYSLVALITVLSWAVAIELVRSNSPFSWLLLSVLGAIGFYTLPTMIYPLAMVFGWLGIRWAFNQLDQSVERTEFIKQLIISGVLTVGLGLLLYVPIFIYSGFGAVFGNNVVAGMGDASFADFWANLTTRWRDSWLEWHLGFPVWVAWLTLLVILVAIYQAVRRAKQTIDFFLIGVLVVVLGLAVQKTVAWTRVWSFFIPLYFTYASNGAFSAFQWGQRFWKWLNWQVVTLALVGLSLIGTFTWMREIQHDLGFLFQSPGTVERTANYLSATVDPDDLILVSAPDSTMIWYYTYRAGVPFEHFQPGQVAGVHTYVVINTSESQTPLSVWQSGFDESLIPPPAFELVFADGYREIYRVGEVED